MSQLGTERVTAGLPSLSPSVRFQTDTREAQQFKQQSLVTEEQRKRDAALAPDGDRPRHIKDASMGMPLHSTTIIDRLGKLNPSIKFQHHPFLPRFQVMKPDNRSKDGYRYICAFEDNYSPQFDVMLWHWEEHVKGFGKEARLEKVRVLDDTVKGWARLLLQLVDERMITKAGAERQFGFIQSKTWQGRTNVY